MSTKALKADITTWLRHLTLGALLLGAFGCSQSPSADGQAPAPSASSGQVSATRLAGQPTYYAAARFAEQASFGATPALVAEIRQKGFEQWIDEQFALPASTIDPTPFLSFIDPIPLEDHNRYQAAFPNIAMNGADQLRTRVAWSLSQFIVTSDRKGDLVATIYWINLLQQRALGRYDELLYAISINPTMGMYLDNDQNRPKSVECPNCAPNENFARELMQLFSLGLVKLAADGTPLRDNKGALLETYTQRDVEELARVFTGWQHDREPPNRPKRNWANWAKPMVPSTWPPERDAGAKQVLGKSFAAGQSQEKDLRDAIDMLMAHPNIAPFVATRLIQHLVKSNPTPAYVGRIASRFRNNGQGGAGDIKAVVKAILLDPEARAGDTPGGGRPDDGKLREPFLYFTAAWRGMGCRGFPLQSWGTNLPNGQRPFSAETVFSYYAPTDRAPGSNLLAPEQKLVTSSDLTQRLNLTTGSRWNNDTRQNSLASMRNAGCEVDAVVQAYVASPNAFNQMLSERYFRGAMPPTLRSDIEQLIKQPQWDTRVPDDGALRMLDYALSSPYFGVIK